jgi:signal transduction histidine kinase
MNVFSTIRSRRRARAGTVRARTTTLAVVVVGGSLIVGGLAMRAVLERSLTSTVREAAFLQAHDDAEGVAEGDVERPLDVVNPKTDFVQVLDSRGRVFDYSANLTGSPPVALLKPQEVRKVSVPFDDRPFLAVALKVSWRGENYTVIAGKSLETVTQPVAVVSGVLLIGVPLLVLVAGLTTWRVVRRALMPVESIRAEVDGISTGDLDRRVPVPTSEDEIARLARTMNAMLARLEESQRRQRRFVSDASHELRSPVSTIRQHAEVALSHPDGTALDDLAEVVLEEDLRLQRVVEDLLLLTKMDEGTLRLRTEPVDLDDLVFEEAGRLRSSTRLQIDTSAVSVGRVLGDREQLARLVRNLTDNAARHSRGNVALSLHQDDGVAVLKVDDDGRGVPPSDRQRIFERFVRLEEARDRDSGGSGLGLAIVAEIAGAHGGQVSVQDAPLGGARFEVQLPSVRE